MQNLIDIIAAPSVALTRLKVKPTFWLPLLLVLALTVSAQLGYFLLNDDGFVRDPIVEQAVAGNGSITNEQRRQMETNIGEMSIPTVAVSSSAAVLVIVPVTLALNAWYLGFMARFSFSELGFRHWFSLMCWTSVPSLLTSLAAWLILLTDANDQVSQSELQALSVCGLLGLDSGSQMLQQFNVTQLWSVVLSVIGFQQWTQSSWLKATVIASAPTVLIYGGLALFTF